MTDDKGDPAWSFLRDPAWSNPGPLKSLGWSLSLVVAEGTNLHRNVSFALRTHLYNPHPSSIQNHEVLIAGDPELTERQVDVMASFDGFTTFQPRIGRFNRLNYVAIVAFPRTGLGPGEDIWLNVAWSWPLSANVAGNQWVRGLSSLAEGAPFEVILRHPVEVAQYVQAWAADDTGEPCRTLTEISAVELDGYQVTKVAGQRQSHHEYQLRVVTELVAGVQHELDIYQAELRRVADLHGQALLALRQIAANMQESPHAYRGLSEPTLRTHVVTALDLAVPGQVTGESISRAGKTDIMIKQDKASVLIVECKKWKSPKSIGDAIDQVLGYSALHQPRLALLLFVTEARMSDIRLATRQQVEARDDFHSWESSIRDNHLRAILYRLPDRNETVQLAIIFVFLI